MKKKSKHTHTFAIVTMRNLNASCAQENAVMAEDRKSERVRVKRRRKKK